MSQYEPFCTYGFCTVYPITCKIEFNPKSDRNEGDVVFKSPEKVNIFLSWGPLVKAKKRYSSLEKHANDSIQRIKKNQWVKEIELVQRKIIEVSAHEAIFSHVKVILSRPNLLPFTKAKTYETEVRCLHLYCNPSRRYFVLYGEIAPEKTTEHSETFEKMIHSFTCHKAEANSTNKSLKG